MEPVYLFNLIDQQRGWLSTRQAIIAQNISNTDTPGYRALDVVPFAKALERSALAMAGAGPLHMQPTPAETLSVSTKAANGWETTHSGNSVSPELEMIKSGEIRTAYSLDTNILHAFHGMWLSAVRA